MPWRQNITLMGDAVMEGAIEAMSLKGDVVLEGAMEAMGLNAVVEGVCH